MPHAQVSERASLRYRADIDGLRTLAVVPVVLYHFHVAPFSGGYVGVDMFFVISGFLITALIHAEMRTGEYTILGFYERRARRILPALFAVLLVSTVAALWLQFPGQLRRFGESAAAAALFVSNFDFWQQANYFDAAAETKPLLHTWSLAVEEQFYLAFPLLLWLFRGTGRRGLLALTGGLALVSFLFGLWAVRRHPAMAFYLAPSRIWELMLGSILALGDFPRPPRWLREALSLLGLVCGGVAIFGFTPDTAMPGENALLPCLGAVLLIHANSEGDTAAARLLSWRPVVFVGLISYSLYLWHWPVYVFAHLVALVPLTAVQTWVLIALSFALAGLSWRFVERPFRDRRRFSRRTIFRLAATGMVLTAVAGGVLFASDGWPQRFAPNIQRLVAAATEEDRRRRGCVAAPGIDIELGRACLIGALRAAPSFVLWGDSHALALLPVVSDVAMREGRAGYYAGRNGCAPLLGLTGWDDRAERCARFNRTVVALVAARHIKTVVVVGRWALYDQGTEAGTREHRRLVEADAVRGANQDQHAVFARALERSVAALAAAGAHVVLVADVPEIDYDVPTALARLALRGGGIDIRPSFADYRARQAFVAKDMEDLHRRYGVTIVEPGPVLCATGRCSIEEGGQPLYRDSHHLTQFGAAHLAALFEPVLRP